MSVSGLRRRNGIWHINKRIFGKHVRKSTQTGDYQEAQLILADVIKKLRKTELFGERPDITFHLAGKHHINTNQQKRSIQDDEILVRQLEPFIGKLSLSKINNSSLLPFIKSGQRLEKSTATINHGLKLVRRILNQAASDWFIEGTNLTWLEVAPKITLLTVKDARQPYPLQNDEQTALIRELPSHLAEMALFKVNTGCREGEVCALQWDWEFDVPELGTTVFVIPKSFVKNGEPRMIALNSTAASVVENRRGVHKTHVFSFKGVPILRMNNTAWRKARERAGLPHLRVHDLKHTFGRRLRSAGVSFEDRQDLLGHKSSRITTHYSAVEISNLIEAAEKACSVNEKPALTLVKRPPHGRITNGLG